MYREYKKKSKFIAMCEEAQRYVDGVGLQNASYVKIKRSIKRSEWYKNLTPDYQKNIDYLMSTEHNVRISSIRSTPLAGYANAYGEENPSDEKWATIYDEIAMGVQGVIVTVPVQFVTPVDCGNNIIPKIPSDWIYDAKIINKPIEVKLGSNYDNPKFDTKIPSKSITSARVKKPRTNR